MSKPTFLNARSPCHVCTYTCPGFLKRKNGRKLKFATVTRAVASVASDLMLIHRSALA